MHPSANVDNTPNKQPIPQHVLERLESEWRQIRENPQTPSKNT